MSSPLVDRQAVVRAIRTWPDPILATPAQPVTTYDRDLHAWADDLCATLSVTPTGIGLAANQVGCAASIVVCRLSQDRHPWVLVNPRIVKGEGKQITQEECLSVPGRRVPRRRWCSIVIVAETIGGAIRRAHLTGGRAICLQHEIDHLQGRTIADPQPDPPPARTGEAGPRRTPPSENRHRANETG